MYFSLRIKLLVTLIVITTFATTVCDSLPKYCRCIESNGNPFNVYAKYLSGGKTGTEFWLYQNKHMCQMFVKNQTEIVIDTSGQIQELTDNYRLWFGFEAKDSVYECRTYQISRSSYAMDCRRGSEEWSYKLNADQKEYLNASVIIREIQANPTLEISTLFQYKSDAIWNRFENISKYNIEGNPWILKEIKNKSAKQSRSSLTDLIDGIESKLYINSVINAFDRKYGTKGFFIFVTHEGIPKYCYKSDPKDKTDKCKTENMKIFMRECYPTTESTTETKTEKRNDLKTSKTTVRSIEKMAETMAETIAQTMAETNTETLNEGIDEGVDEGVDEGIHEGIDEGVDEGVDEGIHEGIHEGIDEGIAQRESQVLTDTTVPNNVFVWTLIVLMIASILYTTL